MSLWNRIGDIASTAGKFTGDLTGELLGAGRGIAQFAWDVGTASFNDADEYNGFIQPFKTASEKSGKDIVKPLASAGGAIMKVPGVQPALEKIYEINQEYIREPATTFNLVQGELNKRFSSGDIVGAATGFFDPDEWKKAYTGAQDISFGQALVGSYRSFYDTKFNIYDPAQREAAFKKSAWGKALSGGFDVAAQLVGDVTLVAGKGVKVLKASQLGVGQLTNANAVAKAAEDITKSQFGVKNRFTKVIDDFTANDSAYALNHPMVKSSSEPGLLASLLGQSTEKESTALILRSALGDPKAMDELAASRADITDALKAARGDLSAVEEYKLFAAPDGTGMIPFLNDNPAIIKEAQDNYRALINSDQYFAKLMQIGEGSGALTRTTGRGLQQVEDFVAKSRAVKFYDKTVGSPKIDVYQPTPFHRLYQNISYLAGERPAGLVDFNDADSYREIVANISRLQSRVNLTPEQSNSLLNNYISAATPEQRFVATQNLEDVAVRALAAKHGVDEEKINLIYNGYKGARTSAMRSIQDRGFMVDTDGSIIRVQELESQSANYLPLMDFDLMDRLLKRNAGTINAFVGKGKDSVFHYADVLQDLFKAGALLRLGYTQRNAIDSQLRIAASVGAMASLRHLGPGIKNIVNNTIKTPARLVDKYLPVQDGLTLAKLQAASTKVIGELDELKAKIGAAETKLSLDPEDIDLLGEVNTLKLLREEKLAVYEHYVDGLNKSKKAQPKDRIGTGSYEITTSDGSTYVLDDAFGGPLGDMFRKIASSGNSFDRMVDSNTDMYQRSLSTKGITQIKPTDPAYFDQWAQTLRQQFGNSAVVRKIVAGESIDDIAQWLKSSPAGRDLRRRLSITSDNSVEYVTRISGYFDNYLPISSNLRSKLSDITANDLRSTFKDPTDLPVIHGNLLEEAFFNVSDKKIQKIINGAFKLLATMPEDTLARNPLYVTLYRKEASRRVNIMAELKGNRFSVEDQQKIMSVSHKVALREMKGILFNIERKTNLAMAMKYINPFFSAQENAYKTWMKFAVSNPAILNKGYVVWQSPNRAGLVTDEEGNPVPVGQTSGNDIIWVGLPKGISRIPGLQSLTEAGIPKGSLDIIFQGGLDVLYNKGNPNIFSDIFPVGPYVAIPISEIVKKQPGLEESLKWALPYGPTKNPVAGLLPTWLNKKIIAQAGLADPQFARSYQLIWNTEQQNAKRDGLPPVSPAKILKMTKDYWNMRVAANLIMPFAPRFDSPYKFYLDKSREYKRIYGIEADAKFLADFPDFFSFTSSLSKNPTGVQSSVVAIDNIKKYDGLISELVNIEPKLVGLVVNDASGYEFSQAAYNYLYNKRVSADSPDKFLSSQSPAEAQKKTDAEKGWIQYNKFMDKIDNELLRRGLTSIQQKGAEDIKFIKDTFINKLSVQTDVEGKPIYNKTTGQNERTAWYDDYLDSDGSKTNRIIAGLGKIVTNEKYIENNKNNVTFKSINKYLEFRKLIANELLSREVRSLDAKANIDLRFVYDALVNKLKNDDKLGFAYVYDRFLSQDMIVDKQLSRKGVE